VAYERITVDPSRMGGLACIRDTRVTVTAVLGHLAAGRTIDQALEDYPYLERADVLAALAFAAGAGQERELPLCASGMRPGPGRRVVGSHEDASRVPDSG
jgi:uncharacterized protein (DUF433 family)